MRENDPVIIDACRTPIGKLRGALSGIRPDDLLAFVFSQLIRRTSMGVEDIDDVFAGCANQAGEDNRNVARMSSLLAGLPYSVPGVTVNRLCASGLEATIQGARAIRTGDARVVLAGGVESMSRAPWSMKKPETAFPSGIPEVYDTSLGWRFPNPSMAQLFPLESMGETAENVARFYQISREKQDQFAMRSHQNAVAASKEGKFEKELLPVSLPQKQGEPRLVSLDEGPRADTNLTKLSQLKPAFRADGTVTAGNSSTLNDGAAALLIASRAYAKSQGWPIRASIKASAVAGVDPRMMGIGPVSAVQKLLKQTGISLKEVDAFEVNEAFAAQTLAVMQELDLPEERVNQWGGAIALGHPLGCSGARILVTLLSILEDTRCSLGIATLCVGVGQGLCLLIERE